MYSVGIVADDLTGAMDTPHGFAASGYDATVLVDPSVDPTASAVGRGTSILGVNTDSRYDDERRAAAAVSEVVTAVPTRVTYKKVASTLRGNFAAEVDTALAASGADLPLVAPAFPSAGRTTEGGVHYVDGAPVAETEYGNDDKGPSSSSLADLLESTDRPVECVPLSTVEAGSERVASAVADALERTDRPPMLICDAREDGHSAAIAEASGAFDVLYAGSGGLAGQLTIPGADTDALSPPQIPSGAPLAIAGSVNATTLARLDRPPDEAVIELDGVALLRGDDTDVAVKRAAHRLRTDRPAVLTAATGRGAVKRTVAAGREHGLPPDEVRDRVATGLAETATLVLRAETPSGLVATGGDVAVASIRSPRRQTLRRGRRSERVRA